MEEVRDFFQGDLRMKPGIKDKNEQGKPECSKKDFFTMPCHVSGSFRSMVGQFLFNGNPLLLKKLFRRLFIINTFERYHRFDP